MTAPNHHVLVVDDEQLVVLGLCAQLEEMGQVVCGTAATAEDAIALAIEHRPKVVLMDMRLQGERDGVDASIAIHQEVGSRVIFITGSREPATLQRINGDHPFSILFKPISFRQFQAAVEAAMAS